MSRLSVLSLLLAACSGTQGSASVEEATKPPRTAVLHGAGSCVGATCTMHFAATASGDTASFSTARCQESACLARKARLTAAGQSKARNIGTRMANVKLAESYGCAGCAGGPIYVAVVHRADGTQSSHSFDPLNLHDVPVAMRDASALIKAVDGALALCESTELVEVEPDCAQQRAAEEGHSTGRP